MEYDRTLKLEFADIEDTVLYLNNACPLEVKKWNDDRFVKNLNGEITNNDKSFIMSIKTGENNFWMSYKDESTRDRDYNYAIEYIDFLMAPIGTNVDEEEF